MKIEFSPWVFLVLLGLCAGAREAGRSAAGPTRGSLKPFDPPRLRIEPAGRVDLGELGPLEKKLQGYTFTNTSGAPITLRLLDLSPGVRVNGPALRRPIPPSASAELVLEVDPAGWAGPQFRNVRLGTDDPGQGAYYLPTRMTVRPDLTVDGVRRSFGDVGCHESPRVEFTLVRETGEPLWVRVTTPLPGYLESDVQAAGARVRVGFTLRAARVRPGMRLGLEQLRLETNAPLQPRFDLYLDWRLHHAIDAVPARVVFLNPEPDTLELRLKSRDGKPFRVLGAELEGDGFQVDRPSRLPAAEQTLAIRRTATGTAKAMLVLRCEGEEEPLRVPVAFVPGGAHGSVDEDVMVVPGN